MVHRIKKDALFIVDGSYLLYRSFYAIKPLYTSSGNPVQAVYGFCRAIKKLIDQFTPSHVIVAWDSKGKSFRSDIYPAYKETRQAPPADLFQQKDHIIKFLELIGLHQIFFQGFEADDIIGGLAQRHKDHQIVLVCPDKDMYQLLSDHVLIFDPFKEKLIDQHDFKKEHVFGPEKVPFFYALLGDASDNIPGVNGIGKKTAQELVEQFDSLDDLYANLDKIKKERIRTLLTEQEKEARLSLELFLLKSPPLETRINHFTFDATRWPQAAPLFQELEFTSLLKGLPIKAQAQAQIQTSMFDQQTTTPSIPEKRSWNLITVHDEATLEDMCTQIKKKKIYALDTETTGYMPLLDQLVGISFACQSDTAYYIPVSHKNVEQLSWETIKKHIKPLLQDESLVSIMHNAKFDQLMLWKSGIEPHKVTFDTILAANLVRNEWQKINLKDLSLLYLQEPMRKFKDIIDRYKDFSFVPFDQAAEYAAHDALQTLKLYPILKKALDENTVLKNIFERLDMPFYMILVHMEYTGIPLDCDRLKEVASHVNHKLASLETKIKTFLQEEGHIKDDDLNLNSPKQIEHVLFDQLKLPVVKKSGTGKRSTDQEVLEQLAIQHPIPNLILQHRELSKLKNTYLDALPTYVNPQTGNIHTNYSQTMVATGRLSSSDPNLQNIPASEGFGLQIRESFVAPRGHIFMSADYSQIELRILAHLSQDPTLISIFAQDRDIHAETASQLFGISLNDVTSEQRQLGKRINFSIIYGMSPFGLAKDLDIKQSEAKTYIEKYFSKYPQVAAWMEFIVEDAIKNGYSQTLYGRRRYIPELKEKNHTLFQAGKRIAVNSPVQGTQADIMKIAMINIEHQFSKKKIDAQMILQIHDEIIIQLRKEDEDAVATIVRKEMDSVVDWEVPLKVTIRTGKNWAEVTK